MSIVTKNGDQGWTNILFNRKLPKYHPLLEACGTIDELNTLLGIAKATQTQSFINEIINTIQKDLIVLMSELAVLPEDYESFIKSCLKTITVEHVQKLEAEISKIEDKIKIQTWVIPGANIPSSMLDYARTICRKAERKVSQLKDSNLITNPNILVYLNRLGDLLWLLARSAEAN